MITTPKQLRRDIIIDSYEAGACHLGSALSCVEILLIIDEIMGGKDVFLFSKASGVSAYYALLERKGVLTGAWQYLKNYPLPSKEVPGVIHSLGSLGHGLSVAVGMAFADRDNKVYCLISDGELNEGSTWEAILFASHHKLSNLTVVVDNNGLQACGYTRDILDLEPLADKFRAFNWSTHRCNGHNTSKLRRFLTRDNKKATMTIADTVKGKGVDFLEDSIHSHYSNLTSKLLKKALDQL